MQRNGPLNPGFRIPGAPGFLHGWSVSVGGCPLAERRATTHPPGSCNPKGEGIKSRGTMQPAASWGGGAGAAPTLEPLRRAKRPCSAAAGLGSPRRSAYALRGKDRIAALWLSGASPTTARLSSPDLHTVPLQESWSARLLPTPSLRLASWEVEGGGGLAQRSSQSGNTGAWGFGVP